MFQIFPHFQKLSICFDNKYYEISLLGGSPKSLCNFRHYSIPSSIKFLLKRKGKLELPNDENEISFSKLYSFFSFGGKLEFEVPPAPTVALSQQRNYCHL